MGRSKNGQRAFTEQVEARERPWLRQRPERDGGIGAASQIGVAALEFRLVIARRRPAVDHVTIPLEI